MSVEPESTAGWHSAGPAESALQMAQIILWSPVCSPIQVTRSTMNVPLICDYGSGFSKVGFSGTEVPQAVFPTILGKLRHDVSDGVFPRPGTGQPEGGHRPRQSPPHHGAAQVKCSERGFGQEEHA